MTPDPDTNGKSHLSTDCAHAGEDLPESVSAPSVTPIYQTSVYHFADLETVDDVSDHRRPGFIYGRFGLPNHATLETIAAKLEKAEDALAVASGMGAIAVALWTLLGAGDELVVAEDSYGGTLSLAEKDFTRLGIVTRFVSVTNPASLGSSLSSKTKVLLVETLSNPLWNAIDIPAVAEVCHQKGVKLLVDNTVATPFLICPLSCGADIVVHSATKFLGGHHDVTAGILAGSKDFIWASREVATRMGASLGPFDAWLTVRGIKTFALRMERICANALQVARFMEKHPRVGRVFYPGLESHPHQDVVRRTMKGIGGGMVSFELGSGLARAEGFLKRLRLIRLAPSLGGVTTTVSHPAKTSHRSLTADQRAALGISDGLLRLSVGIEEADDILEDLERGLISEL
jgi:cystathionine gamma-synthase